MPVIDIANPACSLPDALIFDTNVLLNLPSAPAQLAGTQQQVVLQFVRRISAEAAAGRLLCIAPVSTFEECYFKIIQNEYNSELPTHKTRLQVSLGRKNVNWHDLYKDSPQLIKSYMPILQRFRNDVNRIPIVPIEPEDLGNPPPSLEQGMFDHIGHVPILPKDAYLLAIAERLNIPHIATLDADFRRATSWLHVYTII